jgi:hypothetical protein
LLISKVKDILTLSQLELQSKVMTTNLCLLTEQGGAMITEATSPRMRWEPEEAEVEAATMMSPRDNTPEEMNTRTRSLSRGTMITTPLKPRLKIEVTIETQATELLPEK